MPCNMPVLPSCCCGYSVRAGTKAIAILSLVYSVLVLLMVGTLKVENERLLLGNYKHNWPNGPTYRRSGYSMYAEEKIERNNRDGVETSVNNDDDDDEEQSGDGDDNDASDQDKRQKLEFIMTMYAVLVSVNFLVSLSLLAGVKLERRWLLVPWITWSSISLVVSQMAVLYAPNQTVSAIPDIFTTTLSIYCILCVISYFQTLSQPAAQEVQGARQNRAAWSSEDTGQQPCVSVRIPEQGEPGDVGRLTVMLPPSVDSQPPSYADMMCPPPSYSEHTETPPTYDPPPPYPGSPPDTTKQEINSNGKDEGKKKEDDFSAP